MNELIASAGLVAYNVAVGLAAVAIVVVLWLAWARFLSEDD